MTGHPANRRIANSTNEKTCVVDGNLDARTTEADSADVKDREEVRLSNILSCWFPGPHHLLCQTDLFSSIILSLSASLALTLPLLRLLSLSALFLLTRISSPVVKSARRTCTNNNPPAKGHIESEVVADVNVPSMGDNKARIKGGRINERNGVAGGRIFAISQISAITSLKPVYGTYGYHPA
jgi:hypothetical protein